MGHFQKILTDIFKIDIIVDRNVALFFIKNIDIVIRECCNVFKIELNH